MNVWSDDELILALQNQLAEYRRRLNREGAAAQAHEHSPEALSADAVKSEFISNVRNEIYNPLASILALAEKLMTADKVDSGMIRYVARSIYLEAFHLNLQVRTVVTAAELESGESALHVSNLEIIPFLEKTLSSFRTAMDHKSLSFEFQNYIPAAPASDCLFRTDAEKLSFVLSALISNAVDFSPVGGVVELQSWKQGHLLNLSVGDRGPGLGREQQWKIFNRFQQLETGSKKTHKGLGLGLSVVRDLIVLLNGTLTVTSDAGKGCVFTVTVGELEAGALSSAMDGNAVLYEVREKG